MVHHERGCERNLPHTASFSRIPFRDEHAHVPGESGESAMLKHIGNWPHVACPYLASECMGVACYVVPSEVLAGTFNVTQEEREHIRIVIRINRLCEIYECHCPF